MKMVFVDAENVGLKELEKLRASAIDKVFVFSKSEAIKQCCEKNLFYICQIIQMVKTKLIFTLLLIYLEF
ncbi:MULTISPECIES: hypothetical protein [Vibrio harveyi group]|uniref:hypothetical protein n=1 Tax=Vibrio harveyi group TaxID=717610 RepID=UPI001F0EF7A6|nr:MULTISPECIES: hypothetical protein [Vibrio harveyi group]MCV3263269.1 hypothetical protein [Vibrio harveyi]MCG9230945.1 hypothetical protein [Vibrio diabolicus]MCG9574444.1 hypothetical protein [Vibrio diabolicus]MCG9593485.1 hypothetical protein [Vibrio diabolicus]MCG9775625.1 hypothetical protein [Vibrio diabolicus]